ncbi:MAG TPA: DUF4439 domain-containing protein [Nocardioides sp.]|nr:DUF4439 domain-containing protein [Nocardioides sp.]
MSGSPVSRRGVLRVAGAGGLFGVLGAGALAGCDLDPGSSSQQPAVPPPDPDQEIVDAARAQLGALIVRLSGTRGTRSLVSAHRRQLAALDGDPPSRTGQHPPLSKAQVVARERRAAERFDRWASASRNGDLARVLASVTAGIRMQGLLPEDADHGSGEVVATSSSVDALQRTLAAEHAAIFELGALGGRASALPPSHLLAALDAAYDAHVERRDQLRTMITAAGGDPVAAAPAYRLPSPLSTESQIEAEALRVQRACAATYAALVAATSGDGRRWAVDALVSTALSETALGGRPRALPGLSPDG